MISKSGGYHGNAISILFNAHLCDYCMQFVSMVASQANAVF